MRVRWNRVSAVAIARRVTVIASLVLVSTLAVGAPVFAAEEGGSHFAFWENPERFGEIIGNFLDRPTALH